MTYKETLSWMFTRLPMFQREGKTAFKKDLTNSLAFSKYLNFPEKSFKSVHVAGTNGKGSSSHMLASILQQSGYNVGLYTSPHLKDFRERIKVNGKKISQNEVIEFIAKNKSFLENQNLSFFEMTVGMAFFYFASKNVDIAIIEVGLGGRLDSTNIITPLVSVITNIGFDHTQFLGETLPEIAFEKAGIIKPNIPVVVGEFQAESAPVFKKIANDKKAAIFFAEDNVLKKYTSDLKGNYQEKNIKTVVQTIEILCNSGFKISEEQLINGFSKVVENTGLLGRWQILNTNPKVICDTAHNKEGLQYVLKQLSEEKFKQLHIVLGVVNDKDLNSILPLFPKMAKYYFCKPNISRGLSEKELQLSANNFGLKGHCFKTVKTAYSKALKQANNSDLIFVGGSTFVVAEVV